LHLIISNKGKRKKNVR